MLKTQLIGKENLSYETTIYLFTNCFNDINYALNGAREAATIKPSEKNVRVLNELEEFAKINEAYYQEAKEYFKLNLKTE